MQELQGFLQAGPAHPVQRFDHFGGGEAELGFFATGILPVPFADARQASAQAKQGPDAQSPALVDQQIQFRQFFQDQVTAISHTRRDQPQPNIVAILVTIADDNSAGRRSRQHHHQFRFAAAFKAGAGTTRDRLDHTALLVDLDRIDRVVVRGILAG